MDTRTLVNPKDIELGDKIVAVLRDSSAHVDLAAAFWWLDASSDEMRLLLATPVYSSRGPREAYLRINSAIEAAGILDFPASTLWAVDPANEIVSSLRRFVSDKASHLAFENCVLDGLHVAYAYIYFIGKARAGARKKRT